MNSFWDILEIAPTQDKKIVKKAYSVKLKKTKPDDDPEGFQLLYSSYKEALNYVENYETFDFDNNNIDPGAKISLKSDDPDLFNDENLLDYDLFNNDNLIDKDTVFDQHETSDTIYDEDVNSSDDELRAQKLLEKFSLMIEDENRNSEIESWQLLEESDLVINIYYKPFISLSLFELISNYNIKNLENFKKPISIEVLNYLNTIFLWTENINELERNFPQAHIQAVLEFVKKLDYENNTQLRNPVRRDPVKRAKRRKAAKITGNTGRRNYRKGNSSREKEKQKTDGMNLIDNASAGFWEKFLSFIIDTIPLSFIAVAMFKKFPLGEHIEVYYTLFSIVAGYFLYFYLWKKFKSKIVSLFFILGFSFYFIASKMLVIKTLTITANSTILLFLLVSILYFAGFESSKLKATPGKLVLNLKVISKKGNQLNIFHAIARTIFFLFTIIGVKYLFILSFFTKNIYLHDSLSKAKVVKG